jgi:hypothetical protein
VAFFFVCVPDASSSIADTERENDIAIYSRLWHEMIAKRNKSGVYIASGCGYLVIKVSE